MTDQADRRKLVEEAMEAHAAKVRRRLVVGGAAVLLVAVAAVIAYVQLGGSPLAHAADRAKEQTARVRFDIGGGPAYRGASLSGELVTTGDNARFGGDGTFTVGGDEPVPATVRKVGGDVWLQPDAAPDGPWTRMDADDATWAPARLIAALGEVQRVRSGGRERVLGREAAHYSGELPLAALGDRGLKGRIPIEAWLDDDGLPVLIRSDVTTGDAVFRLEVEVLEWDVPVEVEAPDVEVEAKGA